MSVLFIALIGYAIFPTLELDFSGIGVTDPVMVEGNDLKIGFLNVLRELKFIPAGQLADRRRYIFKFNEEIPDSEFAAIVRIVANRFSYRNDKDIRIEYDTSKQEIIINCPLRLSQEYVINTVSSSGDFEVLKYNDEQSESSVGFLDRNSYEDLGITNKDFLKVSKLALDERLPEDPAARFEIRITFSEKAHTKISKNAYTTYHGAFVENEYVGMLQNFSGNRYILATTENSGDSFYSVYGILKSGPISYVPELDTINSINPVYDHEYLQFFFMQYIFVIAVVFVVMTMLFKRNGFISVMNTIFAVELTAFVMKMEHSYLSEFALFGFVLGTAVSLLVFAYNNLTSVKRNQKLYVSLLLLIMAVFISYISNRLIPVIEANVFLPLIFIMIFTTIILFSLNKYLTANENKF